MEPINLPKSYFADRNLNDKKRVKSFLKEKIYISKILKTNNFTNLKVLDVGCSTGEFIEIVFPDTKSVDGIEPSSYAAEIAEKKSIKIIEEISGTNKYDVIIYRGSIQLIPSPFKSIEESYNALKKGGKIFFLATPNTRSIYFYIFKTLPLLNDPFMNWFTSDANLRYILERTGFKILDISYPYLDSPYSNPPKDLFSFLKKLFTGKGSFPFPGNLIQVAAEKNCK